VVEDSRASSEMLLLVDDFPLEARSKQTNQATLKGDHKYASSTELSL